MPFSMPKGDFFATRADDIGDVIAEFLPSIARKEEEFDA